MKFAIGNLRSGFFFAVGNFKVFFLTVKQLSETNSRVSRLPDVNVNVNVVINSDDNGFCAMSFVKKLWS